MTDETDDTLDDLLSADLDDETTPAEHARIEADAELRSRREDLRAAATFAGRPPSPLGAADVDRIVGVAAEALDADQDDQSAQPPVAPARPIRRHPTPGQTRWLVAAAVVLLAAIGVRLIATDTSSDRATNASKGVERQTQEKSAAPPGSAAPHSGAERLSSTTTAPNARSSSDAGGTIGFLGRFASADALRSALRTRMPALLSGSEPTGLRVTVGQADRCASVVEAGDPGLTRPNRRSAVAASVAGEPVLVLEYRARAVKTSRPTTRVIVMGVAACDERLNFER